MSRKGWRRVVWLMWVGDQGPGTPWGWLLAAASAAVVMWVCSVADIEAMALGRVAVVPRVVELIPVFNTRSVLEALVPGFPSSARVPLFVWVFGLLIVLASRARLGCEAVSVGVVMGGVTWNALSVMHGGRVLDYACASTGGMVTCINAADAWMTVGLGVLFGLLASRGIGAMRASWQGRSAAGVTS